MHKDYFLSGALNVPWPIHADGSDIEGSDLAIHSICIACQDKECRKKLPSSVYGLCSKGFNFYQKEISGNLITVFGVFDPKRLDIVKNKSLKEKSKGRRVPREMILSWFASMERLESVSKKDLNHAIQNNGINPLHDTIKWAQEISNISEGLIEAKEGAKFSDKFSVATKAEKSLYKAARMLIDTYDSVTIYINPSAASFPKRRKIQLYKLVDKIVRILNEAAKDKKQKSMPVRLTGASNSKYSIRENFKLIPMALIQNAIKYSINHDQVNVEIHEDEDGAYLIVESIGPFIETDELDRIFEKGVRGKWAQKNQFDGSGIGLFTASVVAEAHDAKIEVQSNKQYDCGGRPIAKNVFSIWIPRIYKKQG